METAAAAAAAGTTPMPTPATVNAAAPSQQSGAQQAAIPGVWRSIIKEAGTTCTDVSSKQSSKPSSCPTDHSTTRCHNTELDHYLDTFRLTRGIHKKVDVSNDALEYVYDGARCSQSPIAASHWIRRRSHPCTHTHTRDHSKLFDLLDREEADHLIKTQFVEGINRCLYAFGGLALPPHLPALDTLWAEASVLLDDEDGQRRGLPRPAFGRIVRRLKMEILLPQHPPRAERPSHAVTATTAAAAPFLNKTPSTLGFLRKSASSFAAPAAAGAEDGGVGVPSACEEVDMKVGFVVQIIQIN